MGFKYFLRVQRKTLTYQKKGIQCSVCVMFGNIVSFSKCNILEGKKIKCKKVHETVQGQKNSFKKGEKRRQNY